MSKQKNHSLGAVAQLRAKEEIIEKAQAQADATPAQVDATPAQADATPAQADATPTPVPVVNPFEGMTKAQINAAIGLHIQSMSIREVREVKDTCKGVDNKKMEVVNAQKLTLWNKVVILFNTPEIREMIVNWHTMLEKDDKKSGYLGKLGVRIDYKDGVNDLIWNIALNTKKVKKIESAPVTH